ncbi:MAG: hypothetical protein ACR2NY_01650 [Alphaproteobacteria bacterium]
MTQPKFKQKDVVLLNNNSYVVEKVDIENKIYHLLYLRSYNTTVVDLPSEKVHDVSVGEKPENKHVEVSFSELENYGYLSSF